MTDVLREDPAPLEHLLRALSHGCPPHGGIALGLDRLLAIITGSDSIRDVIAFPKTAAGRDPMSDSPAEIAPSEMELYNIQVKSGTASESEDENKSEYSDDNVAGTSQNV